MKRKLEVCRSSTNDSSIRAQLAQLRRGIGSKPGDMPELWGILFSDMPEALLSKSGEPTQAEWAVYTALTLYALHQQGRSPDSENMHKDGVRLGQALAQLAPTDEDKERVARRFNSLATSGDMAEAAYYLRGLIQLLRAEGIGLDYVLLAQDLFSFQFPKLAPEVRLK